MFASPHWQQEILEWFSIPQYYRVEDCGQCFSSTFDSLSLVVPRIDIQLTSQQLTQLQNMFSPLAHSDEVAWIFL